MNRKKDEHFIVFEGAPASGKTSTLNALKGRVNKESSTHVVFIPETAAHLLCCMPDPVREVNTINLQQYYIYRSQTLLEETMTSAFSPECGKRILYLLDRGCADAYAYTPAHAASVTGHTVPELLARYDAVLYFQSGSEENFKKALKDDHETPRMETYKDALTLDETGMAVWSLHESFYLVPYMTSPGEKTEAVICLINAIAQDKVFT